MENSYEISRQRSNNIDTYRDKYYYNINKYSINTHKDEIKAKMENDYNYYLFKSKRVNSTENIKIENKTSNDKITKINTTHNSNNSTSTSQILKKIQKTIIQKNKKNIK